MRFILLLIVLLVIAFLAVRQTNVDQPIDSSSGVENSDTESAPVPPKVPTNPGDVKKFEQDFNQYMSDTEAEQKKRMEEAMQ